MSTELGLLGFLHQAPMHGYEIHQRLRAAGGPGMVWRMKPGHLYAVLARLEGEGLIVGDLQPQDARPARRVFRLTQAGRSVFREWSVSPVNQGRGMRQEFLVKLFFARVESLRSARRLIAAQREVCLQWLELQRPSPSGEATLAYADLVRRFRAGQIEAMLTWLEECEARLPSMPGHLPTLETD